jgi:diaminopimelate dehydrogenase
MDKIRVLIVSFGNISQYTVQAIQAAPDVELVGVVRREGNQNLPANAPSVPFIDEEADVAAFGKIDVAILGKASRQNLPYAEKYLKMGIHTVDSFDIHPEIVHIRNRLDPIAKAHNAVAVVSVGFDPGIDSVIRAWFEIAAPWGITYTDFGPGMSMGHTTVVKAMDGVQDALSVTLPKGGGTHRRMVYVQLKEGADFNAVEKTIKTDPYFMNDETHVRQEADIQSLIDKGHGARITRKGRSGLTDNQQFLFDTRINNPAMTAQMLVGGARAAMRQKPGAYTVIEIPPVDFLAGTRDENIIKLV